MLLAHTPSVYFVFCGRGSFLEFSNGVVLPSVIFSLLLVSVREAAFLYECAFGGCLVLLSLHHSTPANYRVDGLPFVACVVVSECACRLKFHTCACAFGGFLLYCLLKLNCIYLPTTASPCNMPHHPLLNLLQLSLHMSVRGTSMW